MAATTEYGGQVDYVRVPALGAASSLLIFFPGIISQGAETHRAATGLTQEPLPTRWAILVATIFSFSAIAQAVQAVRRRVLRVGGGSRAGA